METADVVVIGSGQGGVPLSVDFAGAGKNVVLLSDSGRVKTLSESEFSLNHDCLMFVSSNSIQTRTDVAVVGRTANS